MRLLSQPKQFLGQQSALGRVDAGQLQIDLQFVRSAYIFSHGQQNAGPQQMQRSKVGRRGERGTIRPFQTLL